MGEVDIPNKTNLAVSARRFKWHRYKSDYSAVMNHNDPHKFSPNSDSDSSEVSTNQTPSRYAHSYQIMGTPFDLGAPRFEYPFPPAQDSPTDVFHPSITPHSHPQLPPWPIHISKSFPLTPPPLGRLSAHPKLRSREPPVPPGLVKRRSRIAGLQHQSSSEEPSDVGDDMRRVVLQSIPIKQALSLPTSLDPHSVDPAGLAKNAAPQVVSASAYNHSSTTCESTCLAYHLNSRLLAAPQVHPRA